MELEFYIVGGYLKIEKKAFIQEMLSKDSQLRGILNWGATKAFTDGHPIVSETDENGIITISFNYTVHVKVGGSSEEMLGKLKAKHREKVKGKVTCRGIVFYTMFDFVIDLDSDDDKISVNY